MAEGRKYGLLKYGRYSYDLWPTTWVPVYPYEPPVDIWVPVPDSPPFTESWTAASAPRTEVWIPAVSPPRFL